MFHRSSLIASVFALFGICACAGPQRGSTVRGSVLTRAPETRAITSGPAEIHVYAGFQGGEIFTAARNDGSNADCTRAQLREVSAPTVLTADRVVSIAIGVGQVACLRTRVNWSYELLWHGVPRSAEPAPTGLMAAVRTQDRQ